MFIGITNWPLVTTTKAEIAAAESWVATEYIEVAAAVPAELVVAAVEGVVAAAEEATAEWSVVVEL